MGCQQSKAKAQPIVAVAPAAVTTPVVPVREEARPVEAPALSPARESSPPVSAPEEPVETAKPTMEASQPRSNKSTSVCSSLASDATPSLSVIFKHGNLDAMLKRWDQRQRMDAHGEAARILVQDVLGEEKLTGMFRFRSFTPATTPAQQDLFQSLMNSFASPPREGWSASPCRQRTGMSFGSLSPAGSPRTGLRAPQPTCVLDVFQEGSDSMPTPDELVAQLFDAMDPASPLTVASPAVARSGSAAVIEAVSEQVATAASPRAESIKAASPMRLGTRAPSTLNVASSPKKEEAVPDMEDKPAAAISFSEFLAQNNSENAPRVHGSPKAVKFDAAAVRKSAPAARKSKNSKKRSKEAPKGKGPVASRFEKGSKSQMQTDLYLQMASAFERQLTNTNTLQAEMNSR